MLAISEGMMATFRSTFIAISLQASKDLVGLTNNLERLKCSPHQAVKPQAMLYTHKNRLANFASWN